MGLPEFYYQVAGLAFGLVVALGVGMIFYSRPNHRVVRLCSWLAAILFVSIAIVWGSTMKSPWIWIPTVGIVGAISAVGLTFALKAITVAKAQSGPSDSTMVDTPSGLISFAEFKRRRELLHQLSGEYWAAHPPAPMVGAAPADWVNQRLKELGENWTIPSMTDSAFQNVVIVGPGRTGIAMPDGKNNVVEDSTFINTDTAIDAPRGQGNTFRRLDVENAPRDNH
jgi:hypothetical protein